MANTTKIKGKVKWFNLQKGYGYIADSEGNDHFIHFSNIKTGKKFLGLDAGDEVEFEIGNGKTGPQAVEVELINPAPKHSHRPKSEDK